MQIKSRTELGHLFELVRKLGKGAEIGVQNGFNANSIFKYWTGKIYLIDYWENPEELTHCLELNTGLNYEVINGDSVLMAENIHDLSLDWVYIDAGHSYEEVKADFNAWFPKVRKGGIISGHDYGINDCIGVKEFIDEYMKLNPEVEMKFTTDDYYEGLEYQTWWFIK